MGARIVMQMSRNLLYIRLHPLAAQFQVPAFEIIICNCFLKTPPFPPLVQLLPKYSLSFCISISEP